MREQERKRQRVKENERERRQILKQRKVREKTRRVIEKWSCGKCDTVEVVKFPVPGLRFYLPLENGKRSKLRIVKN